MDGSHRSTMCASLQAQTFRDQFDQLTKLGAKVFGISGDSLDEQKSFAAAQNLPFPLLVDDNDALRKVSHLHRISCLRDSIVRRDSEFEPISLAPFLVVKPS